MIPQVLKDAVVVAAVAGLVFQSLRQWVGEHYLVPSNSMQPTLYGAADGGDVVWVDKLASGASLQRYDLAVFRLPDEGAHLVKRVVAFEDEWVEARDGDLWVGPSAQQVERLVKDPLAYRDMRVPWWVWPSSEPDLVHIPGGAAAGDGLAVPAFANERAARRSCALDVRQAAGAGGDWLRTAVPIDDSYLDALGHRGNRRTDLVVRDFGVDLRVATTGVERVMVTIEHRPEAWTVSWAPATGDLELWRAGETVVRHRLQPPDGAGRQSPGAAEHRIECGFLDGRFFFAVDGDRGSLWTVPFRREWLQPDPGPQVRELARNGLAVAAVAAAAVPLSRFELFRDIHWYRPKIEIGADPAEFEAAKLVDTGRVYLLGDNAEDSRDSRVFGAVPLERFVGRPRLVLGPWPRTRWLAR